MIEQTATALTNAMPILAATVFPTLACLAITFGMEWHRLAADDPTWTYDDYKPTTEPVGRHDPANIRPVGPDHLLSPAALQLVTRTEKRIPAGPDEDTGLLDVRRIRALRVNTVNTGGAS